MSFRAPWTPADQPRQSFEVAFPRDLTTKLALGFIRSLAGPLRRGVSPPRSVAIELYADGRSGLSYLINVPDVAAAEVQRLLLAHLPGAVLTPVPPTADPVLTMSWSKVIEIGLNRPTEPLHTAGLTTVVPTMLSAFGGLQASEALLSQWVIYDANPVNVATTNRKAAEPRWRAVGRIAVAGSTAELLLGRLRSAYSTLSTEDDSVIGGVQVQRRLVLPHLAEQRLRRRAGAVLRPSVVTASELVALAAWPLGRPHVPGLKTAFSRRLAAHHHIPLSGGVLLGSSNFPGDPRPLAVSERDRAAHCLVVGPTGAGKTTLIENMIASDLAAGAGLAYVDPKGDSIGRVLDLVPPKRLDDVMLFDVTDLERPTGFNALAGSRPDRTAGQLMLVFDQLFGFSASTPRAYDVLRNTLMSLATCGHTIIEVPLALLPGPRGDAVRDQLLSQLDNPELRDFWAWFGGLSARDQAEVGAPITRRLRPLVLYPELRLTFGQVGSGLDLPAAIAQRKIILVPLSSAQLHEEANLVGTLFLNELWTAAQTTPHAENFGLYVDEFKDLVNLAVPFGDVLAKARGSRLPITLGTQDVSRLSEGMRRDVMNNTRTKVLLQPAASDLKYLRAELGEWATDADLANLGPHEFIARINVGGATTPPVSGVTPPPPTPLGLGQAARAASRTRYGRPGAEVEADIRRRLDVLSGRRAGPTPTAGPVDAAGDPADWADWEEWQ
ncbi:hypothetical protein [Kitasatospora sp. NPDC050463]|uniref:hypothetical protein n=1 Tax=Kitasatospora sp. NPDC050463 TaxID=3155786 RepID=UPI003400031C